MTDEAIQRAQDAEENRKSYEAVMKVGAEFGVPFSMALTTFFTSLVMANGVWASIGAFVVVYLFVFFVVKMFFSH